jgi:hypothetical protein
VYPKYKSAYAQKHYFVPRNIPEISFNNGIAILFISNISAISWREQVTFIEIIVPDQHA